MITSKRKLDFFIGVGLKSSFLSSFPGELFSLSVLAYFSRRAGHNFLRRMSNPVTSEISEYLRNISLKKKQRSPLPQPKSRISMHFVLLNDLYFVLLSS